MLYFTKELVQSLLNAGITLESIQFSLDIRNQYVVDHFTLEAASIELQRSAEMQAVLNQFR